MPAGKKILIILIYSFLVFCILFIILALRPITTLQMNDCKSSTGIGTAVWAHENSKDIHLRIGDEGQYYINRGLKRGLTEEALVDKILNKKNYHSLRRSLDSTRS